MRVRVRNRTVTLIALAAVVLLASPLVSVVQAQWITSYVAGAPGRGWPLDGVGGGPDVDFIQERDGATPAPGNPANTGGSGGGRDVDDDYYYAGEYPAPIGTVATDEIAFERAFAGTDNDLRIHFNLPASSNPADRFRFSFEANNLDERAENPDPRYGIEVLFNDNLIFAEMTISPAELNTVFTSPEFTAGDVGAIGGPGGDNVILVRGINHNNEGGGNWMGIDYHHLETIPIPEPGCLTLLAGGLIFLLPFFFRGKK